MYLSIYMYIYTYIHTHTHAHRKAKLFSQGGVIFIHTPHRHDRSHTQPERRRSPDPEAKTLRTSRGGLGFRVLRVQGLGLIIKIPLKESSEP